MLLCGLVVAGISVPGEARLEVRLMPRGGSLAPVQGRVLLRSIPDARAADQPVTREIAFAGDAVSIDEAPGTRWDLSVRLAGHWAPPLTVTIPPAGESRQVQVPVWPMTSLSGHLRFPDRQAPPKVVTVAVESPPQPNKRSELARGTQFDCALAADGSWACKVPAATLDLVIRVKGYAPVYRWDVALAAEKPLDLGELRLQRGGSVTAWLDRESAKLLRKPATARLVRMTSPESSQTTARLSAPVAEAVFDDKGVTQLVSVPPGTYVLTVTATGFAPARAFPIEVFAGSETALRKPLTLEPPMTVRLAIRPGKAPNGAPWLVDLRRVNDFGAGHDEQGAVRTHANADGSVSIADQAPGLFQITISERDGSVFVRRDLDLRDGSNVETAIDVPLQPVKGRVLLGTEPLPAELWFGGRNANVSVRLTTDAEGAFEGSLPHDGAWLVQVVARSPRLETLVNATVDEHDLVIRVPDTTVRGFVVDPEGGPVDRIEVVADASGRSVTARANPDGTFAFRGLPESEIAFHASDLRTGRHSSVVSAAVKAGEPREGVALRMEPQHPVSGRVVSRGTPVIGARISALGLMEGGTPQARAVSNEEGTFELQLPSVAKRAWIVVAAPGKTLQNYEVALTGSPLLLELEPVGGTLQLMWPKESFPAIKRAGVPLMIPDLTPWARSQGQTWQGQKLVVPNLAPGPYQACTMGPVKGPEGATPQPRCAEGVLAPGGTLTLDLGS